VAVSIEEAVALARRELLKLPGVVAVSYRDGVIVVYVESEEVAGAVPRTYRGFPVEVRVVGRVGLI
jgi:hypothetical protein